MLQVDKLSRMPLYEQIVQSMEREIASGLIAPGEQIPSVRELALSLAINPNTIAKAYGELDRRGIIRSVPGIGTFVSEDAAERLRAGLRDRLAAFESTAAELFRAGMGEEELLACVRRGLARAQQAMKGESK